MVAQIYVDDIIFGGMLDEMDQTFVMQMQSEFEMSLEKYAKSIVKKFGLENASHKLNPAPTHFKLTMDEKGVGIDQSLYRSMIGSLLYLTASRPDITFAIGVCARYQEEPKVIHLNQVKRILKYVNGTYNYGILYSHNSNTKLLGYCDADWDGSVDDRKSTSGGCFFLGNNFMLWFSKKHNCVWLSTSEAEYIAADSSFS
ncbi:secreted RxLR effector protein 161-like [Vicia villosa]|uniref:secreted RxLR effector protein 161-like n=1 Tax=Vicia villosa TaxID=3911 RepID=UPI00273B809D|nr:secreted RxLR effector protein 161-like [Vicia villosa]